MSETPDKHLTVTVKSGPGYESSWAVFHGDPWDIAAQMGEFFGLSTSGATTPHQVLVMAEAAMRGTAAMAATGATVTTEPVETEPPKPKRRTKAAAPSTEDAPAPAAAPNPDFDPETADSPNDYGWLHDLIDAQTSVDGLRKLWAKHRDAFNASEEALTHWKSYGKTLQASTK